MNETMVTLVGNAATGPLASETALGTVVRLRFAVQPRRWDREQQVWTDGPASFYTVWARRSLAANLSSSVDVGDPLVVHGRLRVKDEVRDGERRFSADVDAIAVGHDMTRGTSAFRRVARADPRLVEPAAVRASYHQGPAPDGAAAASAATAAPAAPQGWAAESPVSWAAQGAPARRPGPPVSWAVVPSTPPEPQPAQKPEPQPEQKPAPKPDRPDRPDRKAGRKSTASTLS